MSHKKKLLSGRIINPPGINSNSDVANLVDQHFNAFNAARLKECCRLLTEKVLKQDVVVGMSLSGALSPAGLGMSCLIPLIRNGWVDWIVSTGANIYHDIHFALGLTLHRGTPFVDDVELHKDGIIRIYDILMDFKVLAATDNWLAKILSKKEFQRRMGTAELHYRIGKHVAQAEEKNRLKGRSFVAEAYRTNTPIYSSAPGDSTIGLGLSAMNLVGKDICIDPAIDVNETSAIVYEAKTQIGESAAIVWGGGSPKNFLLQTEPQLQEILGFHITGHDYYMQVTDARPDTGGLSGATPHEAVSWSKIDPDKLSNTIVCYCDTTIAMPIVVSYIQAKAKPRKQKALYASRTALIRNLKKQFAGSRDIVLGERSVEDTVAFLRSKVKKTRS
jgi:deoxyhypusine synthase